MTRNIIDYGLQVPELRSSRAKMSNDDEIQSQAIEDEKSAHIRMDAAFCARMHTAIAAGLESAADWRHHHAWNQEPQVTSRT